ncbi:MAG: hypothetical protein DWI29_03520 [Planctomycetota bacterium]|nr:MAG: hypothetical protein DWI29_03520 [Planctomycetota bacterium]
MPCLWTQPFKAIRAEVNRQFLHRQVFDAGLSAASDWVSAGCVLLSAEQRPQQIFLIGSMGKSENPFGAGKHYCRELHPHSASNTTPAAAVTMTTIVGRPIGP